MKSTRIGVPFLSHFWTISIHFYRDLFILSLQSIAKYRDVSVAKTTAGAWVSSAGPEVSRQRARNSAGPKAIAFYFRRNKSRWFGFIVEYRWGGKKNNFSWTGKACDAWNISSIFLWFCYCSALELSVLSWLICPGSTDPRHNPNLNRDQNDPEFWYHAARKPFNKAPKMLPNDQRECNVLDMIPDFFSLWSLCCTDVELASKDKIWIPVQGFSLSSKSLKCARLCCAQSSIGIADERWITEFRAANRISPFFIYILVGTLILFRGKSMRFHEWKPFDHCHFQGLAEAIWAGTELSRLFRVVKFLWQCMVPFTAIDRTKWHHDIHVHLPKVKDMNQKRELLAELLEARNPSAGWSWSYDVMLIIYIY